MINVDTLRSLVEVLKKNNIKCGIGGSFLLQIYELCDTSNDVDFWVAPEDISTVRTLFSGYREIVEKISLPAKYHFKVQYYDIEADFVACFITKPGIIYNIIPENVEWIDIGDGVTVPCTSLEDWYIVYKLLKNDKKANLIRKYLHDNNADEAYNRLLSLIKNENNKLPKRVKQDVFNVFWDTIQYDLNLEKEREEDVAERE